MDSKESLTRQTVRSQIAVTPSYMAITTNDSKGKSLFKPQISAQNYYKAEINSPEPTCEEDLNMRSKDGMPSTILNSYCKKQPAERAAKYLKYSAISKAGRKSRTQTKVN